MIFNKKIKNDESNAQDSNLEINKQKSKGYKIFSAVFWPVFYVLAIFGICISAGFIFHNTYYLSIFVSGSSMQPTLNNRGEKDIVDFGIADAHSSAIDKIKRFDVIITYYQWESEGQSLKIKRVWGLPGETISLTIGADGFTFTAKDSNAAPDAKPVFEHFMPCADFTATSLLTMSNGEKSFNIKRNASNNRSFYNVVLKENEYYVMGDNWTGSSDCYKHGNSPLIKNDIHGVVVAIEGYATKVGDNKLVDKVYTNPKINF